MKFKLNLTSETCTVYLTCTVLKVMEKSDAY